MKYQSLILFKSVHTRMVCGPAFRQEDLPACPRPAGLAYKLKVFISRSASCTLVQDAIRTPVYDKDHTAYCGPGNNNLKHKL